MLQNRFLSMVKRPVLGPRVALKRLRDTHELLLSMDGLHARLHENLKLDPSAMMATLTTYFRLVVTCNRLSLYIPNYSKTFHIPYNISFLTRLTSLKKGQAESSPKAFYGTVHDNNKNLSPHKKTWLKWHIKLGHLSFNHTRKLGAGGFLDKLALGLSSLLTHEAPQCEACCYGKLRGIH
jgi:hypothetical protein